MKLNTLKDLEKFKEEYTYEDSVVTADELKEEAIRWIKHWKSQLTNEEVKDLTQDELFNCCRIDLFCSFFNITEEELK